MATNLSYGKRMLKAALQSSGLSKRTKRLAPDEAAECYSKAGIDKDCFELKYISDYKGYGVFSTMYLAAGDFLMQYTGDKLTEEEGMTRLQRNKGENKLFFYTFNNRKWCIDAEESHGRLCQMVNDAPDDSCNSVMKLNVFNKAEYLCLFALKDINPGDELLYNYGDKENLWWRKKEDVYDFDSDSDPFSVDDGVVCGTNTDDSFSSDEEHVNSARVRYII